MYNSCHCIYYFAILADINDLKTKIAATGESMASMCQVIDAVANSNGGNEYDCCSNSENNQTRCIERQFANSGFITSPGTSGQCKTSDALCNV